jgi:hypothetical protein
LLPGGRGGDWFCELSDVTAGFSVGGILFMTNGWLFWIGSALAVCDKDALAVLASLYHADLHVT